MYINSNRVVDAKPRAVAPENHRVVAMAAFNYVDKAFLNRLNERTKTDDGGDCCHYSGEKKYLFAVCVRTIVSSTERASFLRRRIPVAADGL